MGSRNPSVNSLKWRQWMNSFRDLLIGGTSPLPAEELSSVASFLSRYPSMQRRHEVFTLIGKQMLLRANSIYLPPITRALLEASLHAPSADERRFRKEQIEEAHAVTRDVVSAYLDKVKSPTPVEACYIRALASRQGWIKDREYVFSPLDHHDLSFTSLRDSGFGVRSEYAWAVSQSSNLKSGVDVKRLFDLSSDVGPFHFDVPLVCQEKASGSDIRHLLQLYSSYKLLLPDSLALMEIEKCVDALACQSMAANALWWSATINQPMNLRVLQWAKICANRADSLTENERWMAITGLDHLVRINRNGLSETQRAQINPTLSLLRSPKRSDIAWKSSLGHIHAFHNR